MSKPHGDVIFSEPVPDSGYRWWYVDGVSHDGAYGVVIIAFVGSVFSPYYFNRRRRGATNPEDYVAINVCLYRPGGDRWAMTERSSRALERDANEFRVGPSRLYWEGDTLVIDVAERSMPFMRRVEGQIRLMTRKLNTDSFDLDPDGRHVWRPVAPVADISVEFSHPGMTWDGHGYMDMNYGSRMLEEDFSAWDWSRSASRDSASIYYVARLNSGETRSIGLEFDSANQPHRIEMPDEQELPLTAWRVRRSARHPTTLAVSRSFEDTPFYSRSLLNAPDERGSLIIHESLDLSRFSSRWVQTLLPFRMPRLG